MGVQFKENNETPQVYYYQRNLQGDVIAIYNTLGAVQAKYSYDAFGNCTVTDSTNSHLANYNPIRYRGYYWDSETNWCFLNARYYSPEWRRFISPDDTAYLNHKNVNGLNLYCYCHNNPIMYVDPTGTTPDNKISSLFGEVGNQLLFGLCLIGNSIDYIIMVALESFTYDAGLGVGLGGEFSVGKLAALGAFIRQDLITFEKEAGPMTMEYTKIGQKNEIYAGLSFLFGFIGKGQEGFSYFATPEYNYQKIKDIDLDINVSIGVGLKLYLIVGGTFEVGFDFDYFTTNMLSDRFATIYGYK